MVTYNFILTVKSKKNISTQPPILLKIGDIIKGSFKLDPNDSKIPDDYGGCDNALNFNFSGNSLICGTGFKLSNFCVNRRILTSVMFSGDTEYHLRLNFDHQSFELSGSDLVPFFYTGEISHFHVEPHYKLFLNITQVIIPPSDPSITIKIGDNFMGGYYIDARAVPKAYSGSDRCSPYGFEGEINIGNTVYNLQDFSINNVKKITSLTFIGDLSYILKLDLQSNMFDLFGDDNLNFHYKGKLTVSRIPSAPTGLIIK